MNLLVLGRGKTGSQVAEVARERGHQVRVAGVAENAGGAALSPEALRGINAVIDFTTPQAAVENITAATLAGVSMVVGTTGWYNYLPKIRELVEARGTGFVWAANFSIGVNIFMDIARAAAAGLRHGYGANIVEQHHAQKKDSPSGTALILQKTMAEVGGSEPPITSLREGDTVGMHTIILDSTADTIMLVHDARSRRGFAEGAVLAAEWVCGKRGFFEFKDVLRELRP